MIRERGLQPFQAHVRRTHNGLAQIIKAMDHMPVMVFLELVVGLHAAIYGRHGVQAVQLVRHRGGEDGGVGPDDGCREVGVVLGVGDGLEAHAHGDELVPGAQSFRLEEVGGVVGGEGLVDGEFGDLRWDCGVLVSLGCPIVVRLCITHCAGPSR